MTLVEVLIALAILGISAAVLMTATSRCLAVVRVSKNYYEARRILELGEIEHPILVIKDKDSSTPSAATDKVLNPNVSPIDYPGGFIFSRSCKRSEKHEDLLEIQTRVTWSLRGKDAFEQVTSYLYFTNDVTF
jgi:prepilin-type N-terminal cleavage/methylation domain-containing protein